MERQLDGELRPLADDALDADPPVVLLDDLPADAQAQAAAAVALAVGLLGRVERLEDQPQLLRRDADAGVADADLGHLRAWVLADLDRQPAAARHRLAGVDD